MCSIAPHSAPINPNPRLGANISAVLAGQEHLEAAVAALDGSLADTLARLDNTYSHNYADNSSSGLLLVAGTPASQEHASGVQAGVMSVSGRHTNTAQHSVADDVSDLLSRGVLLRGASRGMVDPRIGTIRPTSGILLHDARPFLIRSSEMLRSKMVVSDSDAIRMLDNRAGAGVSCVALKSAIKFVCGSLQVAQSLEQCPLVAGLLNEVSGGEAATVRVISAVAACEHGYDSRQARTTTWSRVHTRLLGSQAGRSFEYRIPRILTRGVAASVRAALSSVNGTLSGGGGI